MRLTKEYITSGKLRADLLYLNILVFAFIFYIAGRPLYKYGEYVYNFPRVNATVVILIFLTLVLFLSAYFFLRHFNTLRVNRTSLIAFCLIAWVCFLQLIQLPYLLNELGAVIVGKHLSRTFIASLLLFFIGLRLHEIFNYKSFWIGLAWIISVSVYFVGFFNSQSVFIYLDGEQIYLMLADAFAILSIFFVFTLESKKRPVVIVLSAFILFTLVSRTSFFLFLASVLLVYSKDKPFKTTAIIFLLFGLVVFSWGQVVDFLGVENRMIRLITTGTDSSLESRAVLFDRELEYLKSNWLTGQYMYDVLATGRTGTYGHNYLSFITAFGVLPFTVLAGLLVFLLYKSFIRKIKEPYYAAFICCLFFVIMEIILARSYMHEYVWLIVGASGHFISRKEPGDKELT